MLYRSSQSDLYREYIVPGVTFQPGETWNIEGGVVAGKLSMKVWAEGEPEPAYPQLVILDPDELPPDTEGLGLFTYVDTGTPPAWLDVTFDDVYFTPSSLGDLNYTSDLDAGDIDLISDAVRDDNSSRWFDMNFDGQVDETDRETWIQDLKHTWIGDSNLDGEFNS
ncbi:MAG: hypothetical protein KDB27_35100, partial [Planctomycetales bacterium]|nr:hypothetical protein [Planctomycetales bacterium]